MAPIVRHPGSLRGPRVVRAACPAGTPYRLEVTMPDAERWTANRTHVLRDYVDPSNGYVYECTTAGTTGAVEPTWPTTVEDTVNDGTVVWTCRADVRVIRG